MTDILLTPEIFDFFTRLERPVEDRLIDRCVQERQKLQIPFWKEYLEEFVDLKRHIASEGCPLEWKVEQGKVWATARHKAALVAKIQKMAMFLRPWRKGPFLLETLLIDAEWRSDWKWDRISAQIPSLENKVVLDCGCNNGYYLFRMAEQCPKAILGVDPNDRFYLQYEFIKALTGFNQAHYELLGVDDIGLFPAMFDALFCLGVIYHRRDPLGMLSTLKNAIAPGGFAVIESITLPGGKGEVTYIADRYSQMRNVYFLPSSQTLAAWMSRVGFKNVKIIDESLTTFSEQRKTEFAHFDTLEEFLDSDDPTKTKEGYPAPSRTIVIGYNL